ncbi:OLC1v1035816C1 [Oldenlandia corymbosa var. corymbosa]|uniref:OLC1v1035816C1 n=1 Tax=Oldenlandia corymbosa var. corymbosa TaxID=529605 RepID=A0AAV1CTY2_OLDCO|nr:OLC1v1035816C1 [Oldenlandia corymbosa var. corymbosa]
MVKAWDHRETEGLGVIKDEWNKKDEECIEELEDDLQKIQTYPKLIKWSNVQSYIPPIPVEKKKDTNRSIEEDKGSNLFSLFLLLLGHNIGQCWSQLYGDEDLFPIVNSDEEESTAIAAGTKKKRKRLVKISEKEKKKKADVLSSKSTAQGENTMPPEELASVQARYNELDEKLRAFADLHISREDLHKWCTAFWFRMLSSGGMAVAIEEVNLAATEYGSHRVAVAGLKRLSRDRPIKAKWFKQFLEKSPRKTMYDALVKVLTKLSSEQLPLWEVLCDALVKMGSPEDMAVFPGDPAIVLSKSPSDEKLIPEVPDEYTASSSRKKMMRPWEKTCPTLATLEGRRTLERYLRVIPRMVLLGKML